MSRLFIATFASEKYQRQLAEVQLQNPDLEAVWRRKIRWVKPERLHMTWVFLGTVSNDLIQPISDMMSNLITNELGREPDKAPMKIIFDKAEVWPDQRKPRQIVLRPSDVDNRILSLARTVRTGLLEFYFDQLQKEEFRSFKPHITLLRVERRQETQKFPRTPGIKLKPSDIVELDDALPVVLNLDKIVLVESHMGKNSSYQVLHEVPMASKR
ncbi:MAG TPA: RNA 2',3'-cyclic phosphodiesterase [Planktothrix sp.]|jgi:2'-5' RNA ligase